MCAAGSPTAGSAARSPTPLGVPSSSSLSALPVATGSLPAAVTSSIPSSSSLSVLPGMQPESSKSPSSALVMAEAAADSIPWERNLEIEVEVLPIFCYPRGAQLRVCHDGKWGRFTVEARDPGGAPNEGSPNQYLGVGEEGSELVRLVLTHANHAPSLDPAMRLDSEHNR